MTVNDMQRALDEAYHTMVRDQAQDILNRVCTEKSTRPMDSRIEGAVDVRADDFAVQRDKLRLILGCSRNLYELFGFGSGVTVDPGSDAVVAEMATRAYARDLLDAIEDIQGLYHE